MTKKLFAAAVFTVVLAANGSAQTTRWLSRYWDGCKPTCSWREHAGNNLSKSCDNTGLSVLDDPAGARCAKDGGTAFTCWDQIPFVDPSNPNLAYGFGATGGVSCGQCFEVTFDGGFRHGTPYATHEALRGKKVIIMGRNTGNDVAGDQIDFMIPGGGLGQFDCFSRQLGHSNLGAQYGGFLADCENQLRWGEGSLAQYQECLRNKCIAAFNDGNQAMLRQGCLFYAEFMMAANNPTGTVRNVDCPQILVDRYGGNSIVQPPGQVVTFTLSVTAAPPAAGSVSRNPSKDAYDENSSVTVTATPNAGYKFNGWTGAPQGVSASDSVITFNITANTNLVANFVVEQVSVRHGVAAAGMARVVLRRESGGLAASLPAAHAYTSYSVIDLQGREIRRGGIGAGTTDLRLDGINRGIVFLKLEGAGRATVLRAVIAR